MLAEERALTSGALWTKPRIGDWRQPGTPLSIRTLLKRLYPAAKTDADLVLSGRLPSPAASAARTNSVSPSCAVG